MGIRHQGVGMEVRQELQHVSEARAIIGVSNAAENMRQFAKRAASCQTTVLLTGETGVGKDRLAEYIHALSGMDRPFVAVDCGLLPPEILESELFGHMAGSYTGATRTTTGLVEKANGGTLFLNEIANLPIHLQSKLLRLAEGKPCRKLGSTEDFQVDTRLITGTNADLRKEVAEKRMRSDLYYRISTIEYRVTPLKARKIDIRALAAHFLEQAESPKVFSEDALDLMRTHDWPGNIRELKSFVDKVLFYSEEGLEIRAKDVEPHLASKLNDEDAPQLKEGVDKAQAEAKALDLSGILNASEREWPTLAEVENAYTCQVLSETRGNVSKAARILGLSNGTLNRKARLDTRLHDLIDKLRKE